MKRLFATFEKETNTISSLLKKNQPKKTLVKSLAYPEGKEVEVSVIAQISSAFNEWLNHIWNTNQASRNRSTLGRVNKLMVRKWVAKMKTV